MPDQATITVIATGIEAASMPSKNTRTGTNANTLEFLKRSHGTASGIEAKFDYSLGSTSQNGYNSRGTQQTGNSSASTYRSGQSTQKTQSSTGYGTQNTPSSDGAGIKIPEFLQRGRNK